MISKNSIISLVRFQRVGDRLDTQLFTFHVSSYLTKGFVNLAFSKPFSYSGHQWTLKMEYEELILAEMKNQRTLGLCASLNVENFLAGMHCSLMLYRLTLVNRVDAVKNLSYEMRDVKFSIDSTKANINLNTNVEKLNEERFIFDDSSLIVELELRCCSTQFIEYFPPFKDTKLAQKCTTLESSTFTYSNIDWKIIINLNDRENQNNSSNSRVLPTISLYKYTETNHYYRIRYKATLFWTDNQSCSIGPIDQMIAPKTESFTNPIEIGDVKWFGNQQGHHDKQNRLVLTMKHNMRIQLDLIITTPISRNELIPTAPQKGKNLSKCRDYDGNLWLVMTDILGTLVHLRFKPILNSDTNSPGCGNGNQLPPLISQNSTGELINLEGNELKKIEETRIITWSVHIIPYDTKKGVVKAMSQKYTVYVEDKLLSKQNYSSPLGSSTNNNESDLGHNCCHEVIMDLEVEKVCDPAFGYTKPNDKSITLRIEWFPTHLISTGLYQTFDDVFRLQRYQLSRRVRMLQVENHVKDKQLHNESNQSPIQTPEPNLLSIHRTEHRLSFSNTLLPASPSIQRSPFGSFNNGKRSDESRDVYLQPNVTHQLSLSSHSVNVMTNSQSDSNHSNQSLENAEILSRGKSSSITASPMKTTGLRIGSVDEYDDSQNNSQHLHARKKSAMY